MMTLQAMFAHFFEPESFSAEGGRSNVLVPEKDIVEHSVFSNVQFFDENSLSSAYDIDIR